MIPELNKIVKVEINMNGNLNLKTQINPVSQTRLKPSPRLKYI